MLLRLNTVTKYYYPDNWSDLSFSENSSSLLACDCKLTW